MKVTELLKTFESYGKEIEIWLISSDFIEFYSFDDIVEVDKKYGDFLVTKWYFDYDDIDDKHELNILI